MILATSSSTILITQCSPKETVTYEVPAWVGDALDNVYSYYTSMSRGRPKWRKKTLEEMMDEVEQMTGWSFKRKVVSRVSADKKRVRGVSIDCIIIDDPLDIPVDEAPLS